MRATGPPGRQRQPEASAPKRVIDPDNREDPSLDREHRRARVRPQAENRREDLGCLGGAVAAEEHPSERPSATNSMISNHGVVPGLMLLLQPFLTGVLDLPDLADDKAQPRHVALQLGQYISRQRRARWGVHRCKTLRCPPPARGQARAGWV